MRLRRNVYFINVIVFILYESVPIIEGTIFNLALQRCALQRIMKVLVISCLNYNN